MTVIHILSLNLTLFQIYVRNATITEDSVLPTLHDRGPMSGSSTYVIVTPLIHKASISSLQRVFCLVTFLVLFLSP